MTRFTKEQLEALKEYESLFVSAVHANYYRSTNTRKLNIIKSVYDEASGEPYKDNWSCSHCILKFLQEVGKKYFEDLEEYNKKAEAFVEVLDEVMADVPEDKPVEVKPEPKKTTTKKTTTTKKKTTKK